MPPVFPAGFGPAGLDPVLPPGATPPVGLTAIQTYAQSLGVVTPLVLAYNPQVLGFVSNADGSLQGVHPIDQQAALAIFIEYGSIASAPTVGSKFRTVLNRIEPQRVQAVAAGELNRCLGVLLAQNAISILRFVVDQSVPGRFLLAIAYTNLKDPRYNPRNPALAAARTLLGSFGSA